MDKHNELREEVKWRAYKHGYIVNGHELEETVKSDERKLDLYKRVFSTVEGKEILEDLMVEGGVMATTSICDSNQLAFQAGKRHMALYIAKYSSVTLRDIIFSYCP